MTSRSLFAARPAALDRTLSPPVQAGRTPRRRTLAVVRRCAVAGLVFLSLGPQKMALAQTAAACRDESGRPAALCPPPKVDLAVTDSAADSAMALRRRLLVGFGAGLLGTGVVLFGLGLGLVGNSPYLRTDSGCNVMGLDGPCVPSQATTGAILGLGVGAIVGGGVAVYFGARPMPVTK